MDGNIHPASCLLHFEDFEKHSWNVIIMRNGAKKHNNQCIKLNMYYKLLYLNLNLKSFLELNWNLDALLHLRPQFPTYWK